MTIRDAIRGWVWDFLLPGEQLNYARRDRIDRFNQWTDYYKGEQKRQLKAKEGQADDNLVVNFVNLVVERTISMLLGGGISFDLPNETDQEYIEEIWEANRQDIVLYDAAQNASVYGTGFFKIVPSGVKSKRSENQMLPRLIVLDPRWMEIITPPEDIGTISGYEMRYNVEDLARKEITTPFALDEWGQALSWSIVNYEANRSTGGRWVEISNVVWEYEFPPIIHWKNLPQANDVWGRSDIEDVLELQDRINFVASNISKIIRYHAHPKTWGRGTGLGNRASWGADEIVLVNGTDAMLQNLEMQTDLGSSGQFYNDLKAALMEISRTVDLSSMKDKVGALTNFGLRVLYNDALDKNDTKRDTLGEALVELNRRFLVLDNRSGEAGSVSWPDPLPRNKQEDMVVDQFLLDRGLASKETMAEEYDLDYETEQDKIAKDKASETSVGAMLLSAFSRGTDVERQPLPPRQSPPPQTPPATEARA